MVQNEKYSDFDEMIKNWYLYREYINQSLKFLKDNNTNTDDVNRILATLMRRNILQELKSIGVTYKKGWKRFPRKQFTGLRGNFDENWLDHPGRLYFKNKSKSPIFITEPYGISLDGLKNLINFCDKNKFSCRIGGINFQSIHFPNSTIQIALSKIKKEGENE